LTNVVAKKENDVLVISGNLSLSVLIKDSSGSISNINKILDVKYERKADYEVNDIFCFPKLNVFSLDCAEKGSNSIDVRAEINVSASVFGKLFIDGVTDIT
jgi:Icc-related predicted phosphoesterase